jgi:hypothetical protein
VKLSTRERRLLAVFALLGSLFGLRALWQLARDGGMGGLPAAGSARVARGRAATGARPARLIVVRTDRLVPDAPSELEIGRDPFRYQPLAPPAPPPPTPEELEAQRSAREERDRLAREAAERAAREAAIPRPPEVTLRYLGSFGPRDRRIAVFEDPGGGGVLNAREGETLQGKFIVDRIGYESVDLRFVGFPDEPPRRLGIS